MSSKRPASPGISVRVTPNFCERVESGLLSYGGDTDESTNPFEVRLGKYVDLELPDEVIGIEALRRIHAPGRDAINSGWCSRARTRPPSAFIGMRF